MEQKAVRFSYDHKQLGLFTLSWQEVAAKYGCTDHHASVLFHEGLLSYDPQTLTTLQETQAEELRFLKTLVFDSGLSRSYARAMLAQLRRPYCYSLYAIYWDFADNRWKEFNDYLERFRYLSLKDDFLLSAGEVFQECSLEELRRVEAVLDEAIEHKEEAPA